MDSEKKSTQVFDNLLFPKIFQTFRMAIQPSKLIIAFLAVAAICLTGWIMDLTQTVVATQGQIKVGDHRLIADKVTELQIYLTQPDQVKPYIEQYKESGERTGVFSTLWNFGAVSFHNTLKSLFAFNLPEVATNIAKYFKAVGWALRYHFLYCIIFFIIKLTVISISGGSLCRITALQFARGEKPGLSEALSFSTKKFLSFFATPLVPAVIIIFIGLVVFVFGLIGNIPRAGELIIGIFMLLALIAGALIAIVLIGAITGFNLMFPAVVYDGSDCFDAISRSFSYVYSKPWRMGFYTAIAAVYGAICYTFVRFFAFLLLWATRWFLQLGIFGDNNKLAMIWPEQPSFVSLRVSPDLQQLIWSEWIAAILVYLVLSIVVGLLVAFIISFYFSANTIIYSLMRNRVDNTALEDIYTHFEDIKTEPTTAESESEESQPQVEPETQSDSSL
jgi:KaiC/GvpD/RAD55 family RecA-like ATPase